MDLLRGNIKTLYFKYLSAAFAWIGLILFERPLLMFFGADETLLALAQRYMIPVKAVFPLFLFNQMLAAFSAQRRCARTCDAWCAVGRHLQCVRRLVLRLPMRYGRLRRGSCHGAGLGSVVPRDADALCEQEEHAAPRETKEARRKSRLTKRGYRRIIMAEF